MRQTAVQRPLNCVHSQVTVQRLTPRTQHSARSSSVGNIYVELHSNSKQTLAQCTQSMQYNDTARVTSRSAQAAELRPLAGHGSATNSTDATQWRCSSMGNIYSELHSNSKRALAPIYKMH